LENARFREAGDFVNFVNRDLARKWRISAVFGLKGGENFRKMRGFVKVVKP
jgi:hypothetical protein